MSTSASHPVRYRATDRIVQYAGSEMCLYQDVVTGASEVLPSITGEILDLCTPFRTLEEHVDRIRQEAPFDELPAESVAGLLEQLAKAGLLASHAQTIERLVETRSRDESCRIESVGILTHNRPEALQRIVDGCATNAARYGRSPVIVVADDSDSAAFQHATIGTLRALRDRHQIEIGYIGETQKHRFAQSLARETGHPADLAAFAMCSPAGWPPAPGANRNALLLDRADEAFLMLDDDAELRMAAIPGAMSHLALSSSHDPTEYWYYRDEAETTRSATLVDEDFIGAHERVVGHSVSDLVRQYGPEMTDLDSLSGDFIRRVRSCGGSVAFTMAGLLGDSGWRESIPYFFTDGESLLRLLNPELDYREALASRQMLRGVKATTLVDSDTCFGFNLGLDNRQLLPPFQTACRNEDGTFGVMVHGCLPNSLTGYLPIALGHSPIPPRRYDVAGIFKHVGILEAADLLPSIIQSWAGVPSHVSAERALTALSGFLGDVAALPEADMLQLVQEQWWGRLSSEISYLESRAQDESQSMPDVWRTDLQRFAHAGQKLLMQRKAPTIRELAGSRSARLRAFQRYIADFGRLLEAWPDFVAGARRLRANGVSLSEPLSV